MEKITIYSLWIMYLIKYIIIYPFAMLFHINKKYKNIWLISERGMDARDNGYHLAKYIHTNHPEIKIAYVITKDSPDRDKIISLAKEIIKGSWQHYLYFCLAEKKISTHIMGYAPDRYFFSKLDQMGFIKKGKKVFLQHGIIKDNIDGLHYPNVHLDLFVCGAKPEFDYVLNKYNFDTNIVKYLGLCRFDNLFGQKVKKQILVMPTWRTWLNNWSIVDGFTKSEYFCRYNNLLNSRQVIDLLEQYGYKMIFYPHYEVQKFITAFQSSNESVKIAYFKDYDVQTLLKESAVLITDYSSVYFDFAYMKKPVIYYHFDYDEYRKRHYNEGYFNYEKDGFGPVVYDIDSLIKNVKNILENNCENGEIYAIRQKNFFPLYDKENCKRNFEAIDNL